MTSTVNKTTLDIDYPGELSRGLVLVRWWLLAISHYLVIGLLLGTGATVSGDGRRGDWELARSAWNGGLVGLLVVIAAVILLFTGRYPRQLFALIIGLNRWVFPHCGVCRVDDRSVSVVPARSGRIGIGPAASAIAIG